MTKLVSNTKLYKDVDENGLVFPCSLGVKIFILNTGDNEQSLKQFVEGHLDSDAYCGWKTRDSRGGKYLAITVSVNAHSREQIDAFYQALHDHELVVMVI